MQLKSTSTANYVAAAIIIAAILSISSFPPADGDLWWQMVYGKYLIENGTLIPDHSIFSWTPAANVDIYCAWIGEVLLYSIHSIAGMPGLFVLRYFVMLLPMAALYWAGKNDEATISPLVWLGYLVCYLGAHSSGGLLKPELLSFGFFVLTVATYFKLKVEPRNIKLCYFFPVITLFWVNSHGGVLVGIAFLGTALAGELANHLFRSPAALPKDLFKHIAISAGLTLVALCCTPYGIDYPLQLVRLPFEANMQEYFNVSAYKGAFAPELERLFLPLYLCLALLLTLPFLIEQVVRRKPDFALLLVTAVFLGLYINFVRMSYFYMIIMAFSLQYLLAQNPTWQSMVLAGGKKTHFVQWVSISIMVGLSAHLVQDRVQNPGSVQIFSFDQSDAMPKTEAEFIGKNLSDHKICNSYGEGGYLMWKLWPNQKVMIDARYFPYKSWFYEYVQFSNAINRGPTQKLMTFDCNLWLVSLADTNLLPTLQEKNNWSLVFIGASAAVFVKKASIEGEWATQAGDDFLEIRMPNSAINAEVLLVNNHDTKLVRELTARMTQRYRGTQFEEMASKATAYANGLDALNQQDYETSYRLLSQSQRKPAPILATVLHLRANQFLVTKLMDDDRQEYAREVALEGIRISPDDPGALFNAGSLSLWLSGQKGGAQKWREYLAKFVTLSKKNPTLFPFPALVVAEAELALATGDQPFLRILPPTKQVDDKLRGMKR